MMNLRSAIGHSLSDSLVMSGRILRHSTRSLDTMITVVAMPMMTMLMFVYVFGGAIDTGAVEYLDYIVPGIILMCIASAVAYTAFRLNNDVTKGIVERFRSMPIAGSSILAGHVLSSLVFNAVSVLLILLLAFLLGLRTEAGILGWLSISGLLLLCTLALTWIAVLFGLLAKSAEGASVFSYLVLGLLFTSSSFVPTGTMPRGLRMFAENQPMTPIIETLRSLMLHQPVGREAPAAVVWCVALLALSCVAAMRIYRLRRTR